MSERLSRERLEEALAECAVDNPAASDDLGAHIARLEAENERLRHDADQWRRHERGVARACEQGIVDLARLTALGEEVGE